MDYTNDNEMFYGFITMIYFLIFLVGFLTNGIVIVIVLCLRDYRSNANKYISNLAFSDLMVTMICIPFTASRVNYKMSWPFSDEMCYIAHYIENVGASVSILSLTALSIERCNMLKHATINEGTSWLLKNRFGVSVFLIWIVSLTVMSPQLFSHRMLKLNYSENSIHKICVNDQWYSFETKLVFEFTIFIIFYLLPLAIVIYSYCNVCKSLITVNRQLKLSFHKKSSQETEQLQIELESQLQQTNLNENIKKSIKVIIKIITLFALTWLPYHVVNLTREVIGYVNLAENGGKLNYTLDNQSNLIKFAYHLNNAHSIFTCLAFSNCATNSLLYILLCIDFRTAFNTRYLSSVLSV